MRNKVHFVLTNNEARRLFEVLEDKRLNRDLKRKLEMILFPQRIDSKINNKKIS